MWGRSVLRLAVVAVVLAGLVLSGLVDPRKVGDAMTDRTFALVLLVQGLGFAINTGRWWLLVRWADLGIPLRPAVQASLAAQFATLVLPALGGNDAVRVTLLRHHARGRVAELTGVVASDRLVGLAGLVVTVVVSTVVLAVSQGGEKVHKLLLLALGLCAAGVVGVAVLLLARKVAPRGRWKLVDLALRTLDGLAAVMSHPRRFAAGVALTCCSMAMWNVAMWAALKMIGSPTTVAVVFVAMPLVQLAGTIPLTPLGLGVGEGFAAFAFGLVGVTGAAAALLVYRVSFVVWTLACGVAWLVPLPAAPPPE